MLKNKPIKELVKIIANRSQCNIKVGAVIYDNYGIFAWGWNHSGDGFGACAERNAIARANRKRLKDSSIIIIAFRKSKEICSFPCPKCYSVIKACKIESIYCVNQNKEWIKYETKE